MVRLGIRPPGSAIVLDISHMHVGTNYTVQTSPNLVDWKDVSSFTAYSSTFPYYTQVDYRQTSAFFRFLWTP